MNEADQILGAPQMARLNVTYNGQQGDLPDAVPYDLPDADLFRIVSEALSGGGIPGIDPVAAPNLTDFMVDRYDARDDVPYNRLSVRPKTPFGGEFGTP